MGKTVFVGQSLWRLAIFFFQAEDGIRDLTVTGVQTCALPISVGHMGLTVLLPLLKLLATMYIALVFFILFVLVPILLLARIPLKPFVQVALEPEIGRASCRERV